jgi:hypothetical protein
MQPLQAVGEHRAAGLTKVELASIYFGNVSHKLSFDLRALARNAVKSIEEVCIGERFELCGNRHISPYHGVSGLFEHARAPRRAERKKKNQKRYSTISHRNSVCSQPNEEGTRDVKRCARPVHVNS